MCHEEISTLKISLKEQENRILSLSIQNKKLYEEIEDLLREKQKAEGKLNIQMQANSIERRNLLLNLDEYENEMDRMDSIYNDIEAQLAVLQC